jgi:hypothetical protein
VLGVPRDADSNTINRAYRQKKWDAKADAEALQRIEAAHSSLMMAALQARMKVGAPPPHKPEQPAVHGGATTAHSSSPASAWLHAYALHHCTHLVCWPHVHLVKAAAVYGGVALIPRQAALSGSGCLALSLPALLHCTHHQQQWSSWRSLTWCRMVWCDVMRCATGQGCGARCGVCRP